MAHYIETLAYFSGTDYHFYLFELNYLIKISSVFTFLQKNFYEILTEHGPDAKADILEVDSSGKVISRILHQNTLTNFLSRLSTRVDTSTGQVQQTDLSALMQLPEPPIAFFNVSSDSSSEISALNNFFGNFYIPVYPYEGWLIEAVDENFLRVYNLDPTTVTWSIIDSFSQNLVSIISNSHDIEETYGEPNIANKYFLTQISPFFLKYHFVSPPKYKDLSEQVVYYRLIPSKFDVTIHFVLPSKRGDVFHGGLVLENRVLNLFSNSFKPQVVEISQLPIRKDSATGTVVWYSIHLPVMFFLQSFNETTNYSDSTLAPTYTTYELKLTGHYTKILYDRSFTEGEGLIMKPTFMTELGKARGRKGYDRGGIVEKVRIVVTTPKS